MLLDHAPCGLGEEMSKAGRERSLWRSLFLRALDDTAGVTFLFG